MGLKRRGAGYAMVVACALVATGVFAVTASAGNSQTTKFCQTNWQMGRLFDGTGALFSNSGACIAWGAHGNPYVTFVVTTSTNQGGETYTATISGAGLLPGATVALVGVFAGDPHQLELFSRVDGNGDALFSDQEIPCGNEATITGSSTTYLGAFVSSSAPNPC